MLGTVRVRSGRVEGEIRALGSASVTLVLGWMRARLSVWEFMEEILNWRADVMSLRSKIAPG